MNPSALVFLGSCRSKLSSVLGTREIRSEDDDNPRQRLCKFVQVVTSKFIDLIWAFSVLFF